MWFNPRPSGTLLCGRTQNHMLHFNMRQPMTRWYTLMWYLLWNNNFWEPFHGLNVFSNWDCFLVPSKCVSIFDIFKKRQNGENEVFGVLYPFSDPDRSNNDFLWNLRFNMCETMISFPKVDYVKSDLAASEKIFRK